MCAFLFLIYVNVSKFILIFCLCTVIIRFFLLKCLKWLVGCFVLGLMALSDSISVYIGLFPKEREKEERNDRQEKKMSKQPHPHLLQAP